MARKRIAATISITQLLKYFSTEEKCIEWLEQTRWNGKPICPHCQGQDSISPAQSKRFTYWHRQCRKYFTVKTGTVMHSSKTTTQNWIVALYYVLTARKGISALQLSKELKVQYRTAWYMLHRIREACAGGQFKLSRVVEVDETYIGGKAKNKHASKKLERHGTGMVGKQAVLGIRERQGRTKLLPIVETTQSVLRGAIQAHVEPNTLVYTDDHGGYRGLPYPHETVRHSAKEYVNGLAHTNGIESVWSVLKRSIHGTWHHVSVKHLQRYINEAAFRLNEGNCEVDTVDRMRSLVNGMKGKRIPYQELVS